MIWCKWCWLPAWATRLECFDHVLIRCARFRRRYRRAIFSRVKQARCLCMALCCCKRIKAAAVRFALVVATCCSKREQESSRLVLLAWNLRPAFHLVCQVLQLAPDRVRVKTEATALGTVLQLLLGFCRCWPSRWLSLLVLLFTSAVVSFALARRNWTEQTRACEMVDHDF